MERLEASRVDSHRAGELRGDFEAVCCALSSPREMEQSPVEAAAPLYETIGTVRGERCFHKVREVPSDGIMIEYLIPKD
jgi:hypothetical protein